MLCFYEEGFFYQPLIKNLGGWSGFAIPDPLEGRISFGAGFVIPNNFHHMNMLLLETNAQDCHVSSTLNLKMYFWGWSGFAIPDPLEGRVSFGDGFVIPNNLHHMNMLLLETNAQDCHVSSTLNLKMYFYLLSPTLIHYRASLKTLSFMASTRHPSPEEKGTRSF